MEISSLLNDPNPSQRNAAKGLVSKWERTGLLEGLNSETERSGMAQLLENQARQLVKEASATGTAANSEEWSGVALPLVRRIFAEFAAKEFVSVQPMNLPSGLVFYLDFKYGTAQPGFSNTGGTSNPIPYGSPDANNSMFGVTSDAADASGGLYGAGRFAYSINEATASTANGACTIAAASSASVNFDTLFTANRASVTNGDLAQFKVVSVPTASIAGFDDTAVRSFVLSSGSLHVAGQSLFTQYPAFTKLSGGNIEFVITGSGVAALGVLGPYAVAYSKQPTDVTRGDFEDTNPFAGSGVNTGIDNGTDIDIPEVNLEMQSDAIVAKTRKLKAVWTPEFAQDLNAYHSIDAEAELTSMLSEYVSMEIDLEILDMLINAAPTTEYWSAISNQFINASKTAFVGKDVSGGGYYNTQGEWFQTLGTKLQKVSNAIHQKTLRGGANFLVTSPQVATILESIPGFAADTDGNKMEFAAGVQKIGAINNRYTVYKNPYMKENVILMGYRGAQFLETGAVYSPYVPLIMTPLVYDPVNFTPRKGVMTRYAKKVVRPEFYGKVYVSGVDQI
tara:strand:- start:452 stop:2143 length:1692 start_codon:yes stop_codon:yes gene_type:complete